MEVKKSRTFFGELPIITITFMAFGVSNFLSLLVSQPPIGGDPAGVPAQAGSAYPGENQYINPPEIQLQTILDPHTVSRMEALPGEIEKAHADTGAADPVFFGLNHQAWWITLIQENFKDLGALAIVQGGMVLFGRFQKDPEQQEAVYEKLVEIAKQDKSTLQLHLPTPEDWWQPLWTLAMEDPQKNKHGLFAILYYVQKSSPNTAEGWLEELARKDFDLSEEVRADLESYFPTGTDPAWENQIKRVEKLVKSGRLDQANEALASLYTQALYAPNLGDAIGQISLLQAQVDGLYQDPLPHKQLPKDIIHVASKIDTQEFLKAVQKIADEIRTILPGAVGTDTISTLIHLGFVHRAAGDFKLANGYFQKAKDLAGEALENKINRGHAVLFDDPELVYVDQFIKGTKRPNLVPDPNDHSYIQAIKKSLAQGHLVKTLEGLKKPAPANLRAEGLALLVQALTEAYPGIGKNEIPLIKDHPITIGRNGDSMLKVDDNWVSKNHAELHLMQFNFGAAEQYFLNLKDVGSSNGTEIVRPGGVKETIKNKTTTLENDTEIHMGAGTDPFVIKIGQITPIKKDDDLRLQQVGEKTWVFEKVQGRKKPEGIFIQEKIQLPPLLTEDYFEQLPVRDIATIPEKYRALIPVVKPKVMFQSFEEALNEVSYLIGSSERIAVRLYGPPGTYKTTLPQFIAAKMNTPLLRFVFSRRTDPSDLDGMWTREVIDGKLVTVFKEGAPTIAMEHGFHLVLDEPDLARAGVLAYLNNITAPGSVIYVRKANGELVKITVHEDFRVYATENGMQEVSRLEHGPDFIRRFVPRYVRSWNQKETEQVLRELYENYQGKNRWNPQFTTLLSLIHDRMMALALGFEDEETGFSIQLGSAVGQNVVFTPRSILRLAERLIKSGGLTPENLSRSIRAEYILPLADATDREIVWDQIRAILKPYLEKNNLDPSDIGDTSIPVPTLQTLSTNYLKGKKIPEGKFIWTDQALRLADEILWNRQLGFDVMLVGGSGQGKTALPPVLADLLGQTYFLKTISSETDEEDLVGGPGQKADGAVAHIPGVLHQGATVGGLVHLDEYFLGESGKMEGTMNPLQDDDRALLLKNPFNRIPRHPEMFIIGSTNDALGGFADRNEQSGAALSRWAVIYLAGEFEMQSEDRQKIIQDLSRKPFSAGTGNRIPLKKPASSSEEAGFRTEAGNFNPSGHITDRGGSHIALDAPTVTNRPKTDDGGRRNWITPLRFSAKVEAQLAQQRYWDVAVHQDYLDRDIPKNLVIDLKDAKILQRLEDGSFIPAKEEVVKALEKIADRLTRQTKMEMAPYTGKIFQILYGLKGSHVTELRSKIILLNLGDLLQYSIKGSLGIGKHEWSHATIDGPHPKYDAHEPGRLFANVVGDPRMNEYFASLRDDFREQLEEFVEHDWSKDWEDEKINRFLTQFSHEQFASAVIYYWRHGEIMPWIVDPKVREALEQALPILKPAFTLFPKSTQKHDVDLACDEFYAILDRAWPFYEALLPDAIQDLMKRMENGESPQQLANPFRRPMPQSAANGEKSAAQENEDKSHEADDAEPEIEQMSWEEFEEEMRREEAAKAQAPSPEPTDGTPESDGIPQSAEGLSPEELEALAKKILEKRAEALADEYEPKDEEQFKDRKDQIQQAKLGVPGQAGDENVNPPAIPLSPQQMGDIKKAQADALNRSLKDNLYLQSLPQSATKAAREMKKKIPPTDPSYLEGHFGTGKKADATKLVQDGLKPVPNGRVMLRRTGVGNYDVDFLLLSDVTTSMLQAGAMENTLKASATAMYLANELKMKYGEIIFAGHAKELVPLGARLASYKARSEALMQKQAAFHSTDMAFMSGTNIREPLKLALKTLEKRKSAIRCIVLVTDGEENVVTHPETLEQLEAKAEKLGIYLVVLAMGRAKHYVPKIFKHYRLVQDNGSDIPEKLIELVDEVHNRRFKNQEGLRLVGDNPLGEKGRQLITIGHSPILRMIPKDEAAKDGTTANGGKTKRSLASPNRGIRGPLGRGLGKTARSALRFK